MAAPTLTPRALNRALLARQHLLAPAELPALALVEHLVGLQAQNPGDPYVALWSRSRDFQPEELSAAIAEHRAVRIPALRTTIHLLTAEDALAAWPLFRPVLARTFRSSSQFARRLDGLDLDVVIAAGRELIEARPLTAAELGARMAERWPGRDPAALAQAIRFLAPVVQPPPRGLWGATGRATWTTLEAWLGRPLVSGPDPVGLARRYLAAFGPASAADLRTWSGLTGLREVVTRLRPELVALRDGAGRELLDLPEAPRPDPETPAPIRFLPEYDNLLLGHTDRRRIIPESVGARLTGFAGTFLLDGFVGGQWRIRHDGRIGRIVLEPFVPLDRRQRAELAAAAEPLLAFLAADAERRDVEFGVAWAPPGTPARPTVR